MQVSFETMPIDALDFSLLDDIALAVAAGRSNAASFLTNKRANRIGPLVELLILGRVRSRESLNVWSLAPCPAVEQLRICVESGGGYHSAERTRIGFTKTSRNPNADDQGPWTAFCYAVQRAAEFSGLPKLQAQGLVGAMREIEENVHLHSQRAADGVVGFRATRDEFEFVVADSGVGVLDSFKQAKDYEKLKDSGTALRLALTDGESRLRGQDPGRGYGFRSLFVGLANLNGHLRFRSDDHALTIDGTSPSIVASRLGQTAQLRGFVASVVCAVTSPGQIH